MYIQVIAYRVYSDQRLTASKVWAAALPKICDFGTSQVINALRHQRFGQIEGADKAIANFACDQRLTASKVWAAQFGMNRTRG